MMVKSIPPKNTHWRKLNTQSQSKERNLVDEGYDVDLYDEIYQQLTEEYLGKFKKTKNIFERSDLYDEYEQKKKDLAKEFFGIDVEHVSLYSK